MKAGDIVIFEKGTVVSCVRRNEFIWWLKVAVRLSARQLSKEFGINGARVYQIVAAVDASHAKHWRWGNREGGWWDRLIAANAFVDIPRYE